MRFAPPQRFHECVGAHEGAFDERSRASAEDRGARHDADTLARIEQGPSGGASGDGILGVLLLARPGRGALEGAPHAVVTAPPAGDARSVGAGGLGARGEAGRGRGEGTPDKVEGAAARRPD